MLHELTLSGKRAKDYGPALIDEADAHRVKDRGAWYILGDGYVGRIETAPNGSRVGLYLHRFVMAAQPHQIVDHIDGNRLDCTRANMRFVSTAQNNRNGAGHGRVPLRGVCWIPDCQRYEAAIWHGRTKQSLGYFDDLQEAGRAYDRAALSAYGEYARTNFPPGQCDPLSPVFDPPEVFKNPINPDHRNTSELRVLLVRYLHRHGMTCARIGQCMGLSESGVYRIIAGKRWAHLLRVNWAA